MLKTFAIFLLNLLSIHANAAQIVNDLSQERVLVIGCGHIEPGTSFVECNCMRQAAKMGRHAHHGHYTVSVAAISNPDIIGDIRDLEILRYLADHKFDVIWLEHTPMELSEDAMLLGDLFQMLKSGGVLVTPLDFETSLEAVTKRCAAFRCSDIAIDENGVVATNKDFHWWKGVLSLMDEHGPIVKDRLRQAIYWKEG